MYHTATSHTRHHWHWMGFTNCVDCGGSSAQCVVRATLPLINLAIPSIVQHCIMAIDVHVHCILKKLSLIVCSSMYRVMYTVSH